MSSYKYKVVLTGEGAVGKTSLVNQFIHHQFNKKQEQTVGIDISAMTVEYAPGDLATLSIWDIAGQQRFEFIRNTFYRGATGALLVFDLSREQTFVKTREWLSDIRKLVGKNIPFVLIGNKADLLEDVGDVVDRDEARAFAENEDSIYIETSARTGDNVEWVFKELTRRIIVSKTQD